MVVWELMESIATVGTLNFYFSTCSPKIVFKDKDFEQQVTKYPDTAYPVQFPSLKTVLSVLRSDV